MFNLNRYMDDGIKDIVDTARRYYPRSPRGLAFTASFLPKSLEAAKKRNRSEENGLHIPPFLIASITSSCNLHCPGCYARAEGICSDQKPDGELDTDAWEKIFKEAEEIGISFILLAGGEPLMNRPVLEKAAAHKGIAFPVFTNGMLMDEQTIDFFDQNRNMIPVFSLEGTDTQTDRRRGEGTAKKINDACSSLNDRKILYAVSYTLTSENYREAASDANINALRANGCGCVFLIEYVPVDPGADYLMLDSNALLWLFEQSEKLKKRYQDTIILSFPGDEEAMGGCLAAGRGFFHINPSGAAEPCPFSPYSKQNVMESGLLGALQSDYFRKVREIGSRTSHTGGCTLFQAENEVREIS
ncbi:MAG: radical SAM/SPASM domain-containing protein [Eubacteriaceae bacterium]|jgi:MoaA/NifB/PqqE/SkfB family radical SAM enzyme